MEKFKSVKRSIARRGSGFFTLCTLRSKETSQQTCAEAYC